MINNQAQTKPLDGLTILDFTSRLPGPLAGHMLEQLGAQVIKVETQSHPDPFKSLKLAPEDKGFQSWYKNFNKDKDTFIVKEDNEEDKERLTSLCKKAHMILMGWPKKIQDIYDLSFDSFSDKSAWGSYLEITGSHNHNRPMHDLNVMAEKGLLSLHIKQWEKRSKAKRIAPPFLPIAGVSFATNITQKVLATALKGLKDQMWVYEKVSLEESIDSTLIPLYAADLQGVQDTFLHSGRYPCYNIYPLKNHRGHLAVACIEEKYWEEFTKAFQLELTQEQRFSDQDEDVFALIQNTILEYSVEEMTEKLKDLHCCLSLIS